MGGEAGEHSEIGKNALIENGSWEGNPHKKQGRNGWRGTKTKVKQLRDGKEMGVGAAVKGASSSKLKVDSKGRTSVSWEAFRSHSGDKIFGNFYMLQTIVGMQNKIKQTKTRSSAESSCSRRSTVHG